MDTAIRSELTRLAAEGRAAFPGVTNDADAFDAWALGRVPDDEVPLSYLQGVSGPELWLAFACARGAAEALAAFERDYFSEIRTGLSRLAPDPALLDDVTQQVRIQLFIPRDDGPPRIAEVVGRGSLRALIRVIALRAGISFLRKHGREVAVAGVEDLLDVPLGAEPPELVHMKAHHRAEFRRSLQEAIDALTARQRNLLRMHFIQRVTLHQLATSYGVDRATVTRWIAQARRDLYRHTRKDLQARLRLDPAELTSFIRVIESGFDVSVQRMLGQDAPGGEPRGSGAE